MARKIEGQKDLFNKGEWWEDEWQDMPEFVQEDQSPFKQLIISFATREDMEAFSKLVDQPIYTTTQSIWYPPAEIGRMMNKLYIGTTGKADES